MAHFYGVMQGARGQATRCATKKSGLTVTAASWAGAVEVSLWYNPTTEQNEYTVKLRQWHGQGESRQLATGTLGDKQQDRQATSPPQATARHGASGRPNRQH